MTVPVFALNEGLAEEAAGFLQRAKDIKEQIKELERQKRQLEGTIVELARLAALEESEEYKSSVENGHLGDRPHFVPTLSEDGRFVAILTERR